MSIFDVSRPNGFSFSDSDRKKVISLAFCVPYIKDWLRLGILDLRQRFSAAAGENLSSILLRTKTSFDRVLQTFFAYPGRFTFSGYSGDFQPWDSICSDSHLAILFDERNLSSSSHEIFPYSFTYFPSDCSFSEVLGFIPEKLRQVF